MFEGTLTAIVTPFDANGKVDMPRLRALVERQIEAGVDGIVPVGTTGESPALDVEEHQNVVRQVVILCSGRVPVIAGTGANATSEAVELTRFAKEAGADATLQVTPYYNKPSQEGLYRHFSTVADLGLPVILYNVPGRTSREIGVDTVARLAAHDNIVAIKEAAGSVDRVSQILDACDISVISGDDGLTLPMMVVGARGVISVASNVIPAEMTALTHAALAGRWEEARSLHRRFYALFNALFIDTNPIPVKAALAMMGLIEPVYRLPLCEMNDDAAEKLRRVLQATGVLDEKRATD